MTAVEEEEGEEEAAWGEDEDEGETRGRMEKRPKERIERKERKVYICTRNQE